LSDDLNIDDLVEETKGAGDISIERKMCINAIMSTSFMKGVKPLLNDMSLIESVMVRTILQWAKIFYESYGTAMRADIQGVYENNRGKLNHTVSQDISDFLVSISQQYASGESNINVNFELDITKKYIERARLIKLKNGLDKHLLTDNHLKAQQLVSNFSQITSTSSLPVNIMEDFSRFGREEVKEDVLFTMPTPLDQLYGPIKRAQLSLSCGPPKSGKSRAMVFMACEALRNGHSVFLVSCEMSADEISKLIDDEILRIRMEEGTAYMPIFSGSGDSLSVKHKKVEREGHTAEEMKSKWRAWKLFNPDATLYLKCFPQKEATIDDIEAEYDILRDETGDTPSMCVIDYLDLLAPNIGDERKDLRLQLTGIYQQAKKLAQKRHIALHSGSQTNSALRLLEAYQKYAEVDFAIGLQQNNLEKRAGVYRLYCLIHRGIPFDDSRAMWMLSNNGVGNWFLDARWSTEDGELSIEVEDDFKLYKTTAIHKENTSVDIYHEYY
jgi:hypothetical protein